MMLKTIIIDDEPFVRKDLSYLLSSHKNVHVASEASTLSDAKQQLSRVFFDLVFLDIGMPGGSGFDLVPFIDSASKIVFVTGHDDYAIQAFEIDALDYLLKPVSKNRLARTLERVAPKKQSPASCERTDRSFVKLDHGGRYVSFPDITAISSIGGNYLTLFLRDNEKLLCRDTLMSWENLLPSASFLRIHRSTIINMDRIRCISYEKDGSCRVSLLNQPLSFTASRRMASRLKDFVRDNIA